MAAIQPLNTETWLAAKKAMAECIALVTGTGNGNGLTLIETMLAGYSYSLVFYRQARTGKISCTDERSS